MARVQKRRNSLHKLPISRQYLSKVYDRKWDTFSTWCKERQVVPVIRHYCHYPSHYGHVMANSFRFVVTSSSFIQQKIGLSFYCVWTHRLFPRPQRDDSLHSLINRGTPTGRPTSQNDTTILCPVGALNTYLSIEVDLQIVSSWQILFHH